jgi:CHAD domain-containing protein
MAYRFTVGHSVSKNIQRIVSEEVEDALDQLTHESGRQRDKSIHEARKSVKKLRGLLKLLRPLLGSAYRRENRALRDIGRGLSQLRDAGAIIETFESVVSGPGSAWKPAVVASIRKGLQAKKRDVEKQLDPPKVMQTAAAGLKRFARRASDWPIKEDGFSALRPGLKATYRDGRRAMKVAIKSSDVVLFHDWRKRAKDHWYHVRLLSELWAGTQESREDSLHELESCLGDDHNLFVLSGELRDEPESFGGEQAVRLFTAAATERQKELRQRAIALGQRLYEEKPKLLVGEFEKMWDIWQGEPKPNELTAAAS